MWMLKGQGGRKKEGKNQREKETLFSRALPRYVCLFLMALDRKGAEISKTLDSWEWLQEQGQPWSKWDQSFQSILKNVVTFHHIFIHILIFFKLFILLWQQALLYNAEFPSFFTLYIYILAVNLCWKCQLRLIVLRINSVVFLCCITALFVATCTQMYFILIKNWNCEIRCGEAHCTVYKDILY